MMTTIAIEKRAAAVDLDGYGSDQEKKTKASKDMRKLTLMRNGSYCHDDSELVSPAPKYLDAGSPTKKGRFVRKQIDSTEVGPLIIVEQDSQADDSDVETAPESVMTLIKDNSDETQSMCSFKTFGTFSVRNSRANSDEDITAVNIVGKNEDQERLLTEAERNDFFAPLPAKSLFKAEVKEFVPTQHSSSTTLNLAHLLPEAAFQSNVNFAEPSFKQKEKTELCKFWLESGHCKFNNECAFAHGEHELVKKTHVASKFRMTLCTSYMSAPFVCQYGVRCQFCHIKTDFEDFDNQRTSYQNLLHENATIMKARIDQVADPDVTSQWNIAMPNKRRMAFFESIIPEKSSHRGKRGGKATRGGQNRKRNTTIAEVAQYSPICSSF